jgi:AcrR family transcriptional regulator
MVEERRANKVGRPRGGTGKAAAAAPTAPRPGGAQPPALPILQAPRPERADAARNRAKVLRAARRLFSERGVENVTIGQIAAASGVAKGTVFHRFGDRAGLARALLDDAERSLQEAIVRGPPPLGPAAPAEERLAAFIETLYDLTDEQADLLIAADGARPGGRYLTGSYAAWHQHAALLLAELRPDAEPGLLAHLALAPLDPELVRHLRREVGVDAQRLRDGARDSVLRLARAGAGR